MRIVETDTGCEITLKTRWRAWIVVAIFVWYRVPFTLTWEPRKRGHWFLSHRFNPTTGLYDRRAWFTWRHTPRWLKIFVLRMQIRLSRGP